MLTHTIRTLYRRVLSRQMRAFSPTELSRPALIVAPHPDDEVLGCGGLIASLRRSNIPVSIVYLTSGDGLHRQAADVESLSHCQAAALAAVEALGVDSGSVRFLNYHSHHLVEKRAHATACLASLIESLAPQQVFYPFRYDFHPDHAAASAFVRAAVRRMPAPPALYEYPVWYWYQWPWVSPIRALPDSLLILRRSLQATFGLNFLLQLRTGLDTAAVLDRKQAALSCYEAQRVRVAGGSPERLSLREIANGDWMDCFFQPFELFHAATA